MHYSDLDTEIQDADWSPTVFQPRVHEEEKTQTNVRMRLLQIHPIEVDGGMVEVDTYPCVLGRDDNCDLCLRDLSVSRHHAAIDRIDDNFIISDRKSTNGVFVNGNRIQSSKLRPGDQIRIGNRVLKFLTLDNIEVQFHEAVYSMMTRDSLTGTFNKRYFLEALEREIRRGIRHERPVSLVMFDIDHFKSVNDSYGHLVGDEVLRQLGQRISDCMADDDVLARYGGEEFAFVLAESSLPAATEVAERCRRVIANDPFVTSAGPLSLTISMGVAEAGAGERFQVSELIWLTDQKLYEAKRSGRNRVCS